MTSLNKLLRLNPEQRTGWPWQVPVPVGKIKNTADYPRVTIITPSFNQGKYLETTIRSVLLQGYPNLEYIIIDGGSKDDSVEIIKKYEPWLTYWVSEKDEGQSDAINKGISMATGEIINWLNSDDYYEPHTLFRIAEAFRDKDTLMVGGRSYLFKGEKEIFQHSSGTDIYPDNLFKTIGWARIDQPETFFRKEAIEVMGLLDTRLHYLMDRDWWIKFLLHYGLKGVRMIPDFLVNFRLHNDSKTVSQAANFQVEHDSYYYSLAKSVNLNSLAEIIKTNTEVKKDFELSFEPTTQKIIERAIHYYFLLRADEFYVMHERKRVLTFLKAIDQEMLQNEDRIHWRKLYYRSKFIPIPVLKMLRRRNIG